MDLRVVKDRILVRRERAILQSPGGIYIPGETTARGRPVNPAEAARPNEGAVLAIGSKVTIPRDSPLRCTCSWFTDWPWASAPEQPPVAAHTATDRGRPQASGGNWGCFCLNSRCSRWGNVDVGPCQGDDTTRLRPKGLIGALMVVVSDDLSSSKGGGWRRG